MSNFDSCYFFVHGKKSSLGTQCKYQWRKEKHLFALTSHLTPPRNKNVSLLIISVFGDTLQKLGPKVISQSVGKKLWLWSVKTKTLKWLIWDLIQSYFVLYLKIQLSHFRLENTTPSLYTPSVPSLYTPSPKHQIRKPSVKTGPTSLNLMAPPGIFGVTGHPSVPCAYIAFHHCSAC